MRMFFSSKAEGVMYNYLENFYKKAVSRIQGLSSRIVGFLELYTVGLFRILPCDSPGDNPAQEAHQLGEAALIAQHLFLAHSPETDFCHILGLCCFFEHFGIIAHGRGSFKAGGGGAGQRDVTVTQVPLTSSDTASEKLRIRML